MKLEAFIADSQVDVEVRQQGSHVSATVDGRQYEIELMRASDQAWLLLDRDRVFDCRIDGEVASGGKTDVVVGAHRHTITLVDPKRLRSAAGADAHGEGAARIVAPMPGKVVRLMVEAGQQVEAGHGVVVVEAMKMQNEMKSPKQGKVITVNVTVGATVNGGDLLAVIE